VDVKAGQKTQLGRKQSWAEAEGDQKLKLIETSPQVNLRRSMCISGIHRILSCSCGLVFPFLKSGGQRCSKLSERQNSAEDKAGQMSKLGEFQCWGDQNTRRKTMRNRAQIAGRTTKLDGCQSRADVKAGQRIKLGGKNIRTNQGVKGLQNI
jgi:hypothetical protein